MIDCEEEFEKCYISWVPACLFPS